MAGPSRTTTSRRSLHSTSCSGCVAAWRAAYAERVGTTGEHAPWARPRRVPQPKQQPLPRVDNGYAGSAGNLAMTGGPARAHLERVPFPQTALPVPVPLALGAESAGNLAITDGPARAHLRRATKVAAVP